VIVIFFIYKKPNKGGDGIVAGVKLSIDQKIDEAKEQNDIEMLKEKMPWLDIVSARWKQILLSDYADSWVSGPTDVFTIGLLTLDRDYLNRIKNEYLWYDETRTIPESLITDEMKGYILQSSNDYGESHLPFQKGYNVSIFIDFDKEIVLFTY
jgi:hypothetical protein